MRAAITLPPYFIEYLLEISSPLLGDLRRDTENEIAVLVDYSPARLSELV